MCVSDSLIIVKVMAVAALNKSVHVGTRRYIKGLFVVCATIPTDGSANASRHPFSKLDGCWRTGVLPSATGPRQRFREEPVTCGNSVRRQLVERCRPWLSEFENPGSIRRDVKHRIRTPKAFFCWSRDQNHPRSWASHSVSQAETFRREGRHRPSAAARRRHLTHGPVCLRAGHEVRKENSLTRICFCVVHPGHGSATSPW